MKIKSVLTVVSAIIGIGVFATVGRASAIKHSSTTDPRLVNITATEMFQELRVTSPSSGQFAVLFARAQNSGLMPPLYTYLNQLALVKPDDLYVKIWLANAAASVANQGLQATAPAPGAIPTLDQQHAAIGATARASNLLQQSKQLLQTAVALQPVNALAQSSLGWFLVQQYNAIPGLQTEGFLRLNRAVSLAPSDALLWFNLGSAYLLPDPHGALPNRIRLAESALKEAAKLDKTFAAPHVLLRSIYIGLHEPKRAAMEAKAAAELTPGSAK